MELPVPKMTKTQAKRLLKLLGELHEKAYRRGFQHGHCAGLGLPPFGPPPTETQVAQWRSRGYGDTEPPPDGLSDTRRKPRWGSATVVERMMCEAEGDIGRWLRDLVSATESQTKKEVM